ncbi:DHA2 family efflux MFS transporter permease subunit [Pasteurella atlantica]|uniref:DHA2 family efflux MFS transporter permease subunit n=2 Tax=Pasteurellaceae TaxID=712 RepID=A0ACC6HJ74_9PAST|nr:DHA2 family efflux MFS transporter permease subunit [Pasteurella atlantica]MDP8050925.1 DHA2 family efflux MFS transporter permease subunit [Pasteurella atlantica]MDP8104195.1 DHA2 family efflux MFS transporter permease subunit [Pasteurella atlantica]MDP8147581.1 DHA2 family efflux MFS transporter permease subunit [Pasteurella atlantica]
MNTSMLKGVTLVILTFALGFATFMQVLDSTIANVAIPTIVGDLGSSSSQGTWIITSFGVSNAISIPITGWLAKRVGEVKLFLISVSLFTLASWLCGMSNSLEMLLVFRVFQGLVSGPLIPLSQSLLLNNYPPEKKSMALAFWSMILVIAPVLGPILGGWISDNFHWGWIFFINVPIGIFVVLTSKTLLANRETKIVQQPLDTIGLVLLVLGVSCFQLMLDQGREQDWFNSNVIIVLAVLAVTFFIIFAIWEFTESNPIIDISLFRSRNFTIGCLTTCMAYLLYIGSVVLMPILLQTVYGYSATWAGLAAAPIGLLPILVTPIIGKFGYKIDIRYLVTFSFIMYSFTFGWRALTFQPEMDFSNVAFPQFVQGLAVACFFISLTTITLSGLPAEKIASATSLFNFLRTLAGSIGTSINITMWYNREALHHERFVEAITPYTPNAQQYYQQMAEIGLNEMAASGQLAREITKQGLIIAANEVFWLSAVIFLGLTVIIWFAKPPFSYRR